MISGKTARWLGVLSLVAMVFMVGGCEDDPQTVDVASAIDGNTVGESDRSIVETDTYTITPQQAYLENDLDTTIFKASGGVLPYSWAVQNNFAGAILESSGPSCVYQRNAAGDNAVVCTDALGQKAYATVVQPEEDETQNQ